MRRAAGVCITKVPPGTRAGVPGPWRTALSIALGLALLGAFVATSDLRQVGDCFRLLGWTAPLVLVPEAVVLLIDTWGWRTVMPAAMRERISLGSL